jgi:2'-5' RNA ligase
MASGSDLAERAPFVLTLEMDGESFSRFNTLRQAHYPPERNMVPAHVTLFYRLPGSHAREIKMLLAATAAGQKRFPVAVGDVKELERGVAVFLHAPQLGALREALAAEWWPWLTEQDRFGFRPHVTIANNVSAGEARTIREMVEATFRAPRVEAVGMHLWRYRDGPWAHEQLFPFR